MGYFAGRYQVAAIDVAGHGESGVDQSWTMLGFGDDVGALVEKLELVELVLIDHSMGGDVIVEAALRLPDRVAGLVWIDTHDTLGQSSTREEIEEFLDPFRRDFATATRNLVRRMLLPGSDADLVEWVAADMGYAPTEVAVDALGHAVNNHAAILAGLGELTAPVVAINPDYRPTEIEALRRHGGSRADVGSRAFHDDGGSRHL